ncbi:MAG: hypothetical protein JXR19_02600 [Bacteroidia bacterium]
MSIISIACGGNNKPTNLKLVNYVGNDPKRFKELMEVFLGADLQLTQITSWAISECTEVYPHLIAPYHSQLMDSLNKDQRHGAIRRNIVRIYQYADIPEDIEGQLFNLCINFIIDPTEAIAVKAFSMTVCERIAVKYPDLIPELKICIESQLDNASAGVKNRGQKILHRFEKSGY